MTIYLRCLKELDVYDDDDYKLNLLLSKRSEDSDKKKTTKLFILGNKELLGTETFFFSMAFFYQAKCVSEKVKIFKIGVNNLKNFLFNEGFEMDSFVTNCKTKMRSILKRLISVANVMHDFIEKKNTAVLTPSQSESKLCKTVNLIKHEMNSKIINEVDVLVTASLPSLSDPPPQHLNIPETGKKLQMT